MEGIGNGSGHGSDLQVSGATILVLARTLVVIAITTREELQGLFPLLPAPASLETPAAKQPETSFEIVRHPIGIGLVPHQEQRSPQGCLQDLRQRNGRGDGVLRQSNVQISRLGILLLQVLTAAAPVITVLRVVIHLFFGSTLAVWLALVWFLASGFRRHGWWWRCGSHQKEIKKGVITGHIGSLQANVKSQGQDFGIVVGHPGRNSSQTTGCRQLAFRSHAL